MRPAHIAIAMVILATAALSHTGATGIVKDRMDAMGGMADQLRVLVPMSRGEIPFDTSAMAAAAARIADLAAQDPAEFFPPDSNAHPSEAAPAIWQDFDHFASLFTELETAARRVETIAQTASEPPATEILDLARVCSACHERYRIKTD